MAAFSRKSSFATVIKFLNMIDLYIYRSNEELKARPIILKSFTTVAKLLFLLNATIDN